MRFFYIFMCCSHLSLKANEVSQKSHEEVGVQELLFESVVFGKKVSGLC